MLAEILLGNIWVKYIAVNVISAEEPVYPYLESISPIIESTTAESGNCQLVLTLAAYRNLGFALGRSARVRDGSKLLFEGVVSDATLSTSLTLQLEA